jgi:hypothetical protein
LVTKTEQTLKLPSEPLQLKQRVQSEVTLTHEEAHNDQVVDDHNELEVDHELVQPVEDRKPNVQVDQLLVELLQNELVVADDDHNNGDDQTRLQR